jgi:hypothetical protein
MVLTQYLQQENILKPTQLLKNGFQNQAIYLKYIIILFITISYIFKGDTKMELETCYVNRNNFEILLKDLLLVKQYRVEVWRRNSKTFEWSIVNSVCISCFMHSLL